VWLDWVAALRFGFHGHDGMADVKRITAALATIGRC
jgi:hypothetical protein